MISGGKPTSTSAATATTGGSTSLLDALAAGSFVPVTGGGYSSTAGNYAPTGFPGASGNSVTVNNNFNGIVGDPNAVAEIIDQVVQNAVDRGTLRVA
jgi:hypothetical protein